MTGILLSPPGLRAVDPSGVPLAGALLQFYLSGTTTPTPVYASADLSTPLANPLVADSTGLFPPMFRDPTVSYRAQLLTAGGSLVSDADPVAAPFVNPAGSVTGPMLATGAAASNLGYAPLNKAGDTATNLVLAFSSLSSTSAGYGGVPVNNQTASYVLALSDWAAMVRMSNASATTITIPPNTSVAFPVGSAIVFRNVGAGVTTITRGSGVTLQIAGSGTSKDVAMAPWGSATAIQEAANAWVISGTGLS